MEIAKVLAVYRVLPPVLVVEAEDGTVLNLSLTELKDGGHRLSNGAWKELLEGYQLFTCRAMPREASRRDPSARQPRPPA
jgi:hypothetical protein